MLSGIWNVATMPCGSSRSDSAAITLGATGSSSPPACRKRAISASASGPANCAGQKKTSWGVAPASSAMCNSCKPSTRKRAPACRYLRWLSLRASTTRLLPVLVMVEGCCAMVMLAPKFPERRAILIPGS